MEHIQKIQKKKKRLGGLSITGFEFAGASVGTGQKVAGGGGLPLGVLDGGLELGDPLSGTCHGVDGGGAHLFIYFLFFFLTHPFLSPSTHFFFFFCFVGDTEMPQEGASTLGSH